LTVARAAHQTPAPIEYLPRKAGPSQEESMLGSDKRNFMSQLTRRISVAAPMKIKCNECVHRGVAASACSLVLGPARGSR